MNGIVGRIREKELLGEILNSRQAEFLALYGRRRIGKTYLIKNYFSSTACVYFHATGIQDAPLKNQLGQFIKGIGLTFYQGVSLAPCQRWMEAFEILTKAISQVAKNRKVVLFIDELPWMATKRSSFLQALDYYWNHHWKDDPRLKLIICGSSASWIIKNIINNRAGLHNRITHSMKLEPFNLMETKVFLNSQGVRLNHQHILDLYMVIGGIPYYLSQVKKGLSAPECIDELCFQKNGALFNEFDRLFSSLFNEFEIHLTLCRTIAKHRNGIGQAQLIKESKVSEGGRITQRLKELEDTGFIMSFIPYGHQEKGIYYKIIDEYTLFYFYWVEFMRKTLRKHDETKGYWLSKSQLPAWKSWAGYAFEAVCYKHLPFIRKALDIAPGAEAGSWRYVPKRGAIEIGAQIDLLFDRPDKAITVCEIKYNEQPFAITKDYAKNLSNKVSIFKKRHPLNKQIFIAMVTSGGLKPTLYSDEIISQSVTLKDLYQI